MVSTTRRIYAMRSSGRAAAALIVLLVGVLAAGVIVFLSTRGGDTRSAGPATAPTTTTVPATRAAATAPTGPPKTYAELLKVTQPALPSTQPLSSPVSLPDAAHFVLTEPLTLCARSDLWITRSDAKPVEAILKTAVNEQTHLTRDRVLYVHWTLDDKGKWQPNVICRGGPQTGAGIDIG